MRILFSLLLLLFSFSTFAGTLAERFVLMDTGVEIKVSSPGREKTLIPIIKDARVYMESLAIVLSSYNERSEVDRINNAKVGSKVKVSPVTAQVIKQALAISRLTGGSFDITVLPLVNLWGFFKKQRKMPPSPAAIEKILPHVGYYYLQVLPSGEVVKWQEGVQITLAGIAKGFIVDEGIRFLQKRKIRAALINAGGDLRVYGKRWRIGVQDPRDRTKIVGVITIKEGAVATSGDYERFWTYKGKRYHHIIDPRSGYPADSGIISATVLSPDCLRADALATALVVKGRDGFSWLNKKEGALLMKEEAGELKFIVSPGMEKYFKKTIR